MMSDIKFSIIPTKNILKEDIIQLCNNIHLDYDEIVEINPIVDGSIQMKYIDNSTKKITFNVNKWPDIDQGNIAKDWCKSTDVVFNEGKEIEVTVEDKFVLFEKHFTKIGFDVSNLSHNMNQNSKFFQIKPLYSIYGSPSVEWSVLEHFIKGSILNKQEKLSILSQLQKMYVLTGSSEEKSFYQWRKILNNEQYNAVQKNGTIILAWFCLKEIDGKMHVVFADSISKEYNLNKILLDKFQKEYNISLYN